MEPKAKWTFMVYMAGDNSLSTAGDKDLAEMRKVGSSQEVNVVAQFDNAGRRGTRRYLIQRKGKKDLVESFGETDSGSPEVLSDFISWTAQKYPAERYALVLWSHGCGWEPTEIERMAKSKGAREFSSREAVVRSASPIGKTFFRTSLERMLALPTTHERAICVDDGSGHSLDTIELGRVLSKAKESLGQPIDLLGMDACLMNNLEVAYQAKPFVRYMVASEESEPGDGWPYDRVLSGLIAQPDQPTSTLASQIVHSYINSYIEADYPDPITQAALDLSRIDPVVNVLDNLAETLIRCMPQAKVPILQTQQISARFWYNTLWDIADFCNKLPKAMPDLDIIQATDKVLEAITPGEDKFLIAEANNALSGEPFMVEAFSGVSIYLPAMTKVSQFYEELDFARDHKWLSMLQAYRS